eukprot:43863-Eustigmatos_ZCMA.PRE.1
MSSPASHHSDCQATQYIFRVSHSSQSVHSIGAADRAKHLFTCRAVDVLEWYNVDPPQSCDSDTQACMYIAVVAFKGLT